MTLRVPLQTGTKALLAYRKPRDSRKKRNQTRDTDKLLFEREDCTSREEKIDESEDDYWCIGYLLYFYIFKRLVI